MPLRDALIARPLDSRSLCSLGCMASFSERQGLKETRSLVQRDDLDVETRLALWNTIVPLAEIFDSYRQSNHMEDAIEESLLMSLWLRDFQRARDERRASGTVWGLVKGRVLDGEWNEAMDVTESIVKYIGNVDSSRAERIRTAFVEALNRTFEKFIVAYRFIGHEITPIDTSAEADAVNAALSDASPVAGAHHALGRAVELLADRTSPDYPNSIKESISAVEAVVKKVTGEGTLGAGLKKLEDSGLGIHPALREAWSKMYGWTSDQDGIRHAGIDAASADQALAKYALVTCSAFVSYLVEESRKVGLL